MFFQCDTESDTGDKVCSAQVIFAESVTVVVLSSCSECPTKFISDSVVISE